MDHLKARITEQTERLKKVKSWGARISKLVNRKKNPMSEAAFCEKYGFHTAEFNRHKNGVTFPRKKAVERVEQALKKEGV